MDDRQLFDSYLLEGLSMTPSFKGFGLEMVWFAQQEREAYRRLFLNKKFASFRELMDEVGHFDEIIYSVQESFHLNRDEAFYIYQTLFPLAFGMCIAAALLEMNFTPEQISEVLGKACRNAVLGLRIGTQFGEEVVPGKNKTMPLDPVTLVEKSLQSVRNDNVDRLLSILIDQDKLVSSLRVNPRYLKDNDWTALENLLDKVYCKFTKVLMSKYPSLTASERRLCVLLKLDFPIRSMSLMLGISPTSVTKSKQRLKARFGGNSPEDTVKNL